jgi:hypothetical protein
VHTARHSHGLSLTSERRGLSDCEALKKLGSLMGGACSDTWWAPSGVAEIRARGGYGNVVDDVAPYGGPHRLFPQNPNALHLLLVPLLVLDEPLPAHQTQGPGTELSPRHTSHGGTSELLKKRAVLVQKRKRRMTRQA